jgi:hypothetical protein
MYKNNKKTGPSNSVNASRFSINSPSQEFGVSQSISTLSLSSTSSNLYSNITLEMIDDFLNPISRNKEQSKRNEIKASLFLKFEKMSPKNFFH